MHITARLNQKKKKGKKKVEVDYCKHNTVFFFFLNTTSPPKERSVNVFCVQTETALSGRHCILKQGHDVFITLNQVHILYTDPGRSQHMRSAFNYTKT